MKDIPGFENIYTISKDSKIWVYPRKTFKGINKKGRFLKQSIAVNGYYLVGLYHTNGFKKHYHVHYLMALTYLDKPSYKVEVNHKDGNTLNNNIENLEWVTAKENQIHSWAFSNRIPSGLGKFGKNSNSHKIILQLDKNGLIIKKFYGGYEAERETGIPQQNISKVLNGHRKFAGGFIWKFHYSNVSPVTIKEHKKLTAEFLRKRREQGHQVI